MDIISPGLRSRSSRSRKLVHQINSNNRISYLIQNQFLHLNKVTETFVSEQYNANSNESELDSTFQDLIYHLNPQDFSLESVLNISLPRLRNSLEKLQDVKIETNQVSNLINNYILLSANLAYSNDLIYNTLILRSQLVYWENLNLSDKSKLIFFIQILPRKFFEFSVMVYNHIIPQESVLSTAGVEEDNFISHTWLKIQRYYSQISTSAKKVIHKSIRELNPTFSIFKSKTPWYRTIRFYLKTPLNIATKEINLKIDSINQQILLNTCQIDSLIKLDYNNFSKNLSTMESFFESESDASYSTNDRLINILTRVTSHQATNSYSATDIPSHLTRYWPIILLLIYYGPSKFSDIYHNRQEIMNWIQYNLVDTTIGFFKNWLLKPIFDVLNILRHDDEITLTSKESLQSDLASLERMVVDFVADENVTGLSRDTIHQSIVNGDLTLLMSKYEAQIRTPYKSLLKGGLVRSLLIQIQKTKVDGAVALTGIDKLLKSQQLLFGLVSVSPSLIILWKLIQYLTTAKPIIINGKQVNMLCLKGLNNIENLLVLLKQSSENREANSDHSEDYEGRLLIEIVNLIITSKLIIPRQLQKDWVEDLNELNNSDFDFNTKLDLIRKIWNIYGHYFR